MEKKHNVFTTCLKLLVIWTEVPVPRVFDKEALFLCIVQYHVVTTAVMPIGHVNSVVSIVERAKFHHVVDEVH